MAVTQTCNVFQIVLDTVLCTIYQARAWPNNEGGVVLAQGDIYTTSSVPGNLSRGAKVSGLVLKGPRKSFASLHLKSSSL